MKRIRYFVYVVIYILVTVACQHQTPEALENIHPKNIILLIGDGMGLTQIQAATTVNGNSLNLQRCENVGMSKTSSADNYITDSAAGATAIACGVKTYNGAIGVDTQGVAVKSILEYAEEAGLATGLIATSTITHATPASFIAHEASRNNYEQIASDFLATDIDVFIGGGLDNFNKRQDGANLVNQLKDNGYQIALNLDELQPITSGKVAGLLNTKAMPSIIAGRGEMLLKASEKALEILSKNEKGFFLMIEGSQIDWGGHVNNIEYVVTELLDFDMVVGAAIDFANMDGNTLVIVTADHETGGLTILGEDILGDSLATNFSTTSHTSVMVPVYASGPQSEKFKSVYENNTLFNKMMEALNLTWQ
jgi:alkaline phosphatase